MQHQKQKTVSLSRLSGQLVRPVTLIQSRRLSSWSLPSLKSQPLTASNAQSKDTMNDNVISQNVIHLLVNQDRNQRFKEHPEEEEEMDKNQAKELKEDDLKNLRIWARAGAHKLQTHRGTWPKRSRLMQPFS